MRPAVAATVVFLAAGAVLLLEILAVRLMAPYVGVSLNTYTGIIGTVLAGISAGAWAGGWSADRWYPARLIGPLLVAGGILALVTAPLTTALGDDIQSDSLKAIVALSAATVFLPAFVLSSVHPIVVKMQLQSLNVTGSVVGRLSAFATAGALVGTFGTGFFLTAHFPTRAILAGVGAVLIVTGAILWWQLIRRVRAGALIGALVAAGAAGGATASVDGPCKVESFYSCVEVMRDGPDGRVLILDGQENSYENLRDPTDLAFPYVRTLAHIADTVGKRGAPITALQIGGGAFTLPRYVTAMRPGSRVTVMEIDPVVIDTAREDFGLRSSPNLQIEEGDARVLIADEAPHQYDVVIGDAFSGRSVPWQLTTEEFLDQVKKRLRPDGVYAMNLIDGGEDLVRAEAATLKEVFRSVALFDLGHNHVLLGSNASLHLVSVRARLAAHGISAVPITGDDLDRLIGDAEVLEDDFAPVDQLLK